MKGNCKFGLKPLKPLFVEIHRCLKGKTGGMVEISEAFQPLISQGYDYTCEQLYLGKKGTLLYPNRSIVIEWSYTQRDGIYVHIKRKDKYKVLFEYADGAYYINSRQTETLAQLSDLKEELDRMSKSSQINRNADNYCKLEMIISSFAEKTTFGL